MIRICSKLASSSFKASRSSLNRKFSSNPSTEDEISLKEFFLDYQTKVNEAPVFKFPIEAIEVLQDPLDFYAAMNEGIKHAKKRIVFSSLYWGIGVMEDYLVEQMHKSLASNTDLRVRVLMDAYRGTRMSKEGSKYLNSFNMVDKLRLENINRDVEVGLWRCTQKNFLTNAMGMTQINEALGVHHVKLAIFDNSLIMTGYIYDSYIEQTSKSSTS
jgi:phosphatidylserine/phosphatidylglycerophosphate/cardiolipin synthase-like enzyme